MWNQGYIFFRVCLHYLNKIIYTSLHFSVVCSSLLLSSASCMDILSFVYVSTCGGYLSCFHFFRLLWINLLWTFGHKSLYGHMFLFLLDKSLGEEFLDHTVSVCLTFKEMANFPNTGRDGLVSYFITGCLAPMTLSLGPLADTLKQQEHSYIF